MDISNKALAMVLVVAIVISIGGTLVSLDRLDRFSSITGFASVDNDTGEVTLEVTSNVTIEFNPNAVDFGSGQVEAGGTCYLSTNLTNSADCNGFTVTGVPFTIINLGNENLTLQIAANATGVDFLGVASALVQIWVVENDTSFGCDTVSGTFGTQWTTAPTSATNICDPFRFGFGVGKNAIDVHVNITMPETTPIGTKALTFTATGTSA